jgi:hypothetical protein
VVAQFRGTIGSCIGPVIWQNNGFPDSAGGEAFSSGVCKNLCQVHTEALSGVHHRVACLAQMCSVQAK